MFDLSGFRNGLPPLPVITQLVTAGSQVGGGGRSEKIRTYNFKENRVTDHRIKLTVHNLDRVLAGELDEIVDALLAAERAAQLEGGELDA